MTLGEGPAAPFCQSALACRAHTLQQKRAVTGRTMSFNYLLQRQNSDLAKAGGAVGKKDAAGSGAKKKLQVAPTTLKRKASVDPSSRSVSDADSHGGFSSNGGSSDSGSGDDGEEEDAIMLPEGPWPNASGTSPLRGHGARAANARMRMLKRRLSLTSVASAATGGAVAVAAAGADGIAQPAASSNDNEDGERRELHSFPYHARSQQYLHAVRQMVGGGALSFQQRHALAVRCWQASSLFHVQDARPPSNAASSSYSSSSSSHRKRLALPRSLPPVPTPFGANPFATAYAMQEKAMTDRQALSAAAAASAAAASAALKAKMAAISAVATVLPLRAAWRRYFHPTFLRW